MGNSSSRELAVLLPDSYSIDKKYPVIWLLDGFMGNGFSILEEPGAVGLPFAEKLLNYQRNKTLQPCIFVFPDCSTVMGGSQYMDSESCGPFLTHFIDELVPFVDSNFSTLAEPHGRVVAGHSSGGYGALVTALLRPGVFGHVIASAADSLFEYSYKGNFPVAAMVINKHGGIEPFLSHFFSALSPEKCSKNDFLAFMTIAMASCYSPHLGANTAHAELPFDLKTLTLKPELWKKWLECDPVFMVEEHWENLKSLHHLHLDCGSEDLCGSQYGHRLISASLSKKNISHHHTEFPGGHNETSFRYKARFELLSQAFLKCGIESF